MCDNDAIVERMTDCGLQAIKTAKEESVRLRHNFIGAEFLLLGLVGHRNTASYTLSSFGLNLKRTRQEVERVIGQGSGYFTEDFNFTAQGKEILNSSLEEAEKAGRYEINSSDILLALIQKEKNRGGSVSKVFDYLDVDIDDLRLSLLERLQKEELPDSSG